MNPQWRALKFKVFALRGITAENYNSCRNYTKEKYGLSLSLVDIINFLHNYREN